MKATPDIVAPLRLEIERVIVEVVPTPIEVGENDFVSAGAATKLAVIVAVSVPPKVVTLKAQGLVVAPPVQVFVDGNVPDDVQPVNVNPAEGVAVSWTDPVPFANVWLQSVGQVMPVGLLATEPPPVTGIETVRLTAVALAAGATKAAMRAKRAKVSSRFMALALPL